jgi:hypothetical protein
MGSEEGGLIAARRFPDLVSGRRCPAGTVIVTTSLNRLAAACPHSALHVEASDPDIIMRRSATSERTMTPARHQAITGCQQDLHG